MRLVLIGDIHAGRRYAAPWQLLSKRLLGMTNMWLNRRRQFDLALLDETLAHAATLAPDMALSSGDLSTTALKSEFDDVARRWERHLADIPTVMVPGNHDRYTFGATLGRTMERHFSQYVPTRFPDLRPLGKTWHLLLIDTAVPRLASSRGRVGRRQCRDIEATLDAVPRDHGIVLLCHYPCQVPPACPDHWDHRLADAQALRQCLVRHPRRTLYLHGHIHRPWSLRSHDPALSHVLSINAGSPTHRSRSFPRGHGFWQFDLPEQFDGPVRIVHHEPDPATAPDSSQGTDTAWQEVTTKADTDHAGRWSAIGPI